MCLVCSISSLGLELGHGGKSRLGVRKLLFDLLYGLVCMLCTLTVIYVL